MPRATRSPSRRRGGSPAACSTSTTTSTASCTSTGSASGGRRRPARPSSNRGGASPVTRGRRGSTPTPSATTTPTSTTSDAAMTGPGPLVVAVVGATATGKSELALDLAEALGGEVVNADASQLYTGMDIGTAKVPVSQRRGIRHHQLDVLDVTQEASVAAYQAAARADV